MEDAVSLDLQSCGLADTPDSAGMLGIILQICLQIVLSFPSIKVLRAKEY